MESADQFVNSRLTPQNIALCVVCLQNGRTHAPDKYDSGRRDGPLSLVAKGEIYLAQS